MGTQSQEQEASYNSYGAFHVLYSRGGCSVLQAGMQEKGKLRFTESKWIQEERRSLSMWATAEEAKP